MADINQETERLAELMADVNRQMADFGAVTQDTQRRLYDAQMKAKYGINNATEAIEGAGKAAGNLAKAATETTKALYNNQKGAAAFGSGLDHLSTAATTAGAAMMLLGGPITALAGGLAIITGGVIKFGKLASEQGEALFKGFQDLSKSGGAASDGISGLFDDIQKLGLGFQDLESFNQLVRDNSQALANFGGSVFRGRQEFARIGQSMEAYRVSLFNAGLNQIEINEGAMAYLNLQTRLGRSQSMTTAQLAEGARNYLVEMDALTKLTGASRKEIEEQRQSALIEEQFRAKIRQLELSGNKEGADRLRRYNDLMTAINPELGKGIRALATGNLAADEAQRLYITSAGQAAQDLAQVIAGTKPLTRAADDTAAAIGRFSDGIGVNLGLLKANDAAFMRLADQQDIRVAREKGFADAEAKILADQQKQGVTGAEAADKAQQATSELLSETQKTTLGLQRLVDIGVAPAQSALAGFAKSLNLVAGLNKTEAQKANEAAREQAKAAGAGFFGQQLAGMRAGLRATFGGGGRQQQAAAPAGGSTATGAQPSAPAGPAGEAPAAGGAPATGGQDAGTHRRNPSGASAPVNIGMRTGNDMTEQEIKNMIIQHEGIRYRPYQDSLGLWTVGIGHLIGDGRTLPAEYNREFSHDEVMAMFEKDYAHHRLAAQRIPGFDRMNGRGQGALTDLTFNMGPAWINGWPILRNQLERGDVEAAAINLENSKWATQVGRRAGTIIDHIRNGIQAAEGGVFSGPKSGYPATLHGDEAVIPLKNGAVPVSLDMKNAMQPGGIGPTFAGMNEYTGYNMGPMSTDLTAIKDIAAKLGAYDASTKMITDPTMWKQILGSGIAMNYDIGIAEIGTKMIPGIGAEIGERIQELKETSSISTEDAIAKVTNEFKTAMLDAVQQMSASAGSTGGGEQLALLTQLVREQQNSNDLQKKMLQAATN